MRTMTPIIEPTITPVLLVDVGVLEHFPLYVAHFTLSPPQINPVESVHV